MLKEFYHDEKIVLCLLAGLGHMQSDAQMITRLHKEVDVEKALEDAKVIRFSITMYRDDTHFNKEAWDEAVQLAARTIQAGSQEGGDAEFFEGVVKSVQTMHKRSNEAYGVHGEIKVGLGDGVCACSSGCECASKYKGLCPCNALEGASCEGESVRCMTVHQAKK